MNDTADPPAAPRRGPNAAIVLIFGILAFSVTTSLATVAVAVFGQDAPLPEAYHWEGWQVDRDFAAGERARQLGVRATFSHDTGAEPLCRVHLELAGPLPDSLRLSLAHVARPKLDRVLTLTRYGDSYRTPCDAIPAAQWIAELGDTQGTWSVRQRLWGTLTSAQIDARSERAPTSRVAAAGSGASP
jgi:hypothetical protein